MFATRETDRLIIRPYSLIHSSAKLGNNRQQALIILMTGRPVHRIAFAFAPRAHSSNKLPGSYGVFGGFAQMLMNERSSSEKER